MSINFKILGVALVSSVIFSGSASSHQNDTRSVVIDKEKRVIKSILSNSCVRTKWENGINICADKVAEPTPPAPRPVVTPAFVPTEPVKPYVPKSLTLDTRSYQVFFDFDSSKLTEYARKVLDNLYNDTRVAETASFKFIGHADRSGANKYNLALSEKRANTVRNYLTSKGISYQDISIDWKGESSPLITTVDGIREAQNRRVDIEVETTTR